MQTRRFKQLNIYHTPLRSPKPDHMRISNINTTVPSFSSSLQYEKKHNQYNIHYEKKKQYDFNLSTAQKINEELQSSRQYRSNIYKNYKSGDENYTQIKCKLSDYEHQIYLLQQYLKYSQLHPLQKKSISRIFNLSQPDQLHYEEQKVIKQLGTKVKNLIKQNNTLKNQNINNINYANNIEEIIQQNYRLRQIIQKYKEKNHLFYEEQNSKLIKEIQSIKKINEKLLILSDNLKNDENLWKNKYQKLSKIYNQEVQDKIYSKNNSIIVNNQKNNQIKLMNQENIVNQINKIKQYYADQIKVIQNQQSQKINSLYEYIQRMNKRIDKSDTFIEHILFQRQNRMHSTIKKSRNVASLSPKPRGQLQTQPQVQVQQVLNNNFSFLNKNKQSNDNIKIESLTCKIKYLQEQLNQLSSKLLLAEKICGQKTERILILENKLLMTQNNNQNNKQKLFQQQPIIKQIIREVPVYKEIIRQVPVIKEILKQVQIIRQPISNKTKQMLQKQKQYVQQVKNIKQSIISCNLSNFDIFHTEFTQILQQRNKMNQKLNNLKKQSKQSSKIILLQKNLKQQKQKNKKLSLKLQQYELQINNLKDQIKQMQNQIQLIKSSKSRNQSMNNDNNDDFIEEQLTDGKAGLEWQNVVRHCLIMAVKRLEKLENRMKQDCLEGNQQQ